MARIDIAAHAIGRIAGRRARQSRVLQAGYGAAQTTARSVNRVLRLLFLQIMGLMFFFFALGLATRIPRAYQEQVARNEGLGKVYLLAALAVMFVWFGATSFWRTRRK